MYLAINSKFRPFSFDELFKPWQEYAKAYEKQQETIESALSQLAVLDTQINSARDPEDRAVLDNYRQQLTGYSDQMAKNGLSVNLAANIRGARRTYASTILPMQKLAERRDELIKEQRALKANAKRGIYFDKDYSTMSLKDMQNADGQYNSVSGESLYAAALAYSNAANKRHVIETMAKATGDLSGYFFDHYQQVGYKPEELNALVSAASGDNEFVQARERIEKEFGLQNLSAADRNRAMATIMSGFLDSTVFQQAHQYSDDPTWNRNMQEKEFNLRVAQFNWSKSQAAKEDQSSKEWTYYPYDVTNFTGDASTVTVERADGSSSVGIRMVGKKGDPLRSYFIGKDGFLHSLLVPNGKQEVGIFGGSRPKTE